MFKVAASPTTMTEAMTTITEATTRGILFKNYLALREFESLTDISELSDINISCFQLLR